MNSHSSWYNVSPNVNFLMLYFLFSWNMVVGFFVGLLTSDESKGRCRIINCYSVNQNSSVFHSSLYPCSRQMRASSSTVWVMRTVLCRKNDKHLRRRNLGLNWGLTAWNFFGILDNTSLPSAQRHVAGFGNKKKERIKIRDGESRRLFPRIIC